MIRVEKIPRLKILIVLHGDAESGALQNELEGLGHRVQCCDNVAQAVRSLRQWQPDLMVTEERLGRKQPDAGLRLTEYCRMTEDQVNGWSGTRTLLLIPVPDWDRFKRGQRAGAHVIVKGAGLDATLRYIQTIADDLATDRVLGPALVGIHRYNGEVPVPKCENCEWVGAEVSYGSSQTDLQHLTPVRIALLNALLFRRRGQSPSEIADVCRESTFFSKILRQHILRSTAIKMEATRLRGHFDKALEAIGAPYSGEHFFPRVPHGVGAYLLSGNRRLIHIHDLDAGDQTKPKVGYPRSLYRGSLHCHTF
jgi:CheY-like chemotaxis protein